MTQPQRKTLAPTIRNTGADQWRATSPHAPHMRAHWHGPIVPMEYPREGWPTTLIMLIIGALVGLAVVL